jgi:hypothetical protein
MRRRDLLRALSLVPGAAAANAWLGSEAWAAPSSGLSQHIVYVHIRGGFDAVLSVDSKTVGSGKVVPGYESDQRLKGKKRLYGPHMKPLMRHEAELTLVHGVGVNTVAHATGNSQIVAGRVAYTESTPWVYDVLGEVLPGTAPLPTLMLAIDGELYGSTQPGPFAYESQAPLLAPGPKGKPPQALSSWRRAMIDAHEPMAREYFGKDELCLREHLLRERRAVAVRQLMRDSEHEVDFTGPSKHLFRTALSAIRNNHAKCIFLWLDAHCDTHSNNLDGQTQTVLPVFEDLALFIDALKANVPGKGRLADRTTLAIGSEIGRAPLFNSMLGKDHWPENSWILYGKGLRQEPGGLTLGETDGFYRGKPLDFETGNLEAGHRRHLTLDSVFATLLAIAGRNPELHDYAKDLVLKRALV